MADFFGTFLRRKCVGEPEGRAILFRRRALDEKERKRSPEPVGALRNQARVLLGVLNRRVLIRKLIDWFSREGDRARKPWEQPVKKSQSYPC